MTIISGGVRVRMNRREGDSSKAASPGRWLLTCQVETICRLFVSITWIWLAMAMNTKSVVPDLSNKSSEVVGHNFDIADALVFLCVDDSNLSVSFPASLPP